VRHGKNRIPNGACLRHGCSVSNHCFAVTLLTDRKSLKKTRPILKAMGGQGDRKSDTEKSIDLLRKINCTDSQLTGPGDGRVTGRIPGMRGPAHAQI